MWICWPLFFQWTSNWALAETVQWEGDIFKFWEEIRVYKIVISGHCKWKEKKNIETSGSAEGTVENRYHKLKASPFRRIYIYIYIYILLYIIYYYI